MRDDEFNFVKINNERDGFSSFEFGHTQEDESFSFGDNKNNIRDEVNDTPTKNSENNKREEKKRREQKENEDRLRDQLSKSESSEGGSSSGSSSSAGGTAGGASGAVAGSSGAIGTIVGATVVTVTAVSTLVGINVFIQAKVKMNQLNVTAVTLDYDLDLTDTYEDKFIITLENKENNYYSYKDLAEGNNVGEFVSLTPDTFYTISVLDTSSDNFVIDTREVKTSPNEPGPTPPGPEPEPGQVVLSFDSDGRSGTMSSFEVEANKAYTLPVSIFVPKDDEYFAGWKINGEGEMLQPGQTVSLKDDTTLVAGWNKFPTKENTVTATKTLFEYNFPNASSPKVTDVPLMGVNFRCQYTYYNSNTKNLHLGTEGGFVSTSTPFGGPISKITINTNEAQTDDAVYIVVYSEEPIYEKVTVGGETHIISPNSSYTFECSNPNARYFCLSNAANDHLEASISSIEFTYLTPLIENSFQVYFDANGGKGTFGPFTVSDTNQEPLPDIEQIGFEAPEGYEFAGWKVKGVNDLLEIGTSIGISSDITLVAQWKPIEPKTIYTITFDANGGTGTMASVQVEKGSTYYIPEVSEWTFVPPEGCTYSDSWFLVNGVRQNRAIPITVNSDLTIANDWENETAELEFHFEKLIGLHNDADSVFFFYSYSYTGGTYPYDSTYISFDVDGQTNVLTVDIDIGSTTGVVSTFVDLTADGKAILSGASGIVKYRVIGRKGASQEQIYVGSFDPYYADQGYIQDIAIGGSTLADEAVLVYYTIDNNSYFPLTINMADYDHGSFGTSYSYNVTKSDSGVGSGFEYVGGTRGIEFDTSYTEETIDSFKITNTRSSDSFVPRIGTADAANVRFVEASPGEIFGFELDESLINNESQNLKFHVVANATSTGAHTYADLDVSSAALEFEFFNEYNSSSTFVVPLDFNSDVDYAYCNLQTGDGFIDCTIPESDYESFYEYIRRYPVNIYLVINDTNRVCSYTKYNFKTL